MLYILLCIQVAEELSDFEILDGDDDEDDDDDDDDEDDNDDEDD